VLSFASILMTVVLALPASQVRRPDTQTARPGTISGVVHDSSGTPLAGFSVVATERKSPIGYGAISNDAGEFRIEGLPPRTFDVLVSRDGFTDVRVMAIAVGPDGRKTLNVEVPIKNTPGPVFRRPGTEPSPVATLPSPVVSTPETTAVRRPVPSGSESGAPQLGSRNLEDDFVTIRNRFDIQLPPWRRYPEGSSDAPYVPGRGINPYRQNKIKGDYPILGNRWFLNLTATSDTFAEGRRLPVPGPASSEQSNTPDFFSRGEQIQFSENLVMTADFFHGLTSFKPVDFRVRVTPVINGTYLGARETGVVNINVAERHTRLDYQAAGLQEAFAEVRLPFTSPKFDFVSVRAGTQSFNSDFRGFVFFDSE